MLRQADLKNYKLLTSANRPRGGLIFISMHAECVHLQLCQVLLYLSKEQRFLYFTITGQIEKKIHLRKIIAVPLLSLCLSQNRNCL